MLKLLALAVVVVLVVGLALAAFKGCSHRPAAPKELPRITVDSIVAGLEPLSELSSLRTNVNGVVSATQEGTFFWQGESKMVLLVNGSALYGVDLDRAQVQTGAEHVAVQLPEPELTAVWVDIDQTRIWERSVGQFMKSSDTELDRAAWKAAQSMVRDSALQVDTIEEARAQAERVVHSLVQRLAPGVTVNVTWGAA